MQHKSVTDGNIFIENTKSLIIEDYSKRVSFQGIHIFVGKSRVLISKFNGTNWHTLGDKKKEPDITLAWQQYKKRIENVFFWRIPEKEEVIKRIENIAPSSSITMIENLHSYCCVRFYPIPDQGWPPMWKEYLPIYPDQYLFGRDEQNRRENPLYRVLFGGVQKEKKYKIRCCFCNKLFQTSNIHKIYCNKNCKMKANDISRKIKRETEKWFNCDPDRSRRCVNCGEPIPMTKRKNAIFCDACNIPWKRRAYYRDLESKKK